MIESEQNGEAQVKRFDLNTAKELLHHTEKIDYGALLKETDVLYLGERHPDYSIAAHVQSYVKELKQNGVKTFALELNPQDQPILDAISKGDLSQMDKLSFSGGFGSNEVEKNKRSLIKALVKSGLFEKGVKLSAIADWSKSSSGEKNEYTVESEKRAAAIIAERAKEGKVVVLIGAEHAQYAKGDLRYPFIHSTDVLKEQGLSVKSMSFIGGMSLPGEYDKSNDALFRRASELQKKSDQAFQLASAQSGFPRDMHYDGVIHIPAVPFKAPEQK